MKKSTIYLFQVLSILQLTLCLMVYADTTKETSEPEKKASKPFFSEVIKPNPHKTVSGDAPPSSELIHTPNAEELKKPTNLLNNPIPTVKAPSTNKDENITNKKKDESQKKAIGTVTEKNNKENVTKSKAEGSAKENKEKVAQNKDETENKTSKPFFSEVIKPNPHNTVSGDAPPPAEFMPKATAEELRKPTSLLKSPAPNVKAPSQAS